MESKSIRGVRLSPQQRRVWLLQKNGPAYCAQCALMIEGELKVEALKSALQEIVERYEIFRTTFRRRPGMRVPIQVVSDAGEVLWSSADLSDLGADDGLHGVDGILREQRRHGFDLENGPNIRAHLVTLSGVHPYRYALIITLPSLCADTISLGILVEDIARHYMQNGKDAESRDRVIQYVQFSEFQNEVLEDEYSETGKEFWRKQELHMIPAITLPFERGTDDPAGGTPDSVTVELGTGLTAKIDDLARSTGVSRKVVLFGGWLALLWKITGRADIVTANIFDGRKYGELNSAAGLLAKAVPVKSHFKGDYRVTEIIHDVDAAMRRSDEWREYFTHEETCLSGGSALEPFIGFEYSDWPSANRGDLLSISAFRVGSVVDQFKLKLNCFKGESSLMAEFSFDPDCYDRDHIRRLASQYQTVLENICADASAKVADLEIMDRAEIERVLMHFNQTGSEYPKDRTFHQLFEEQVDGAADKIAVAFEGQLLTYAELNARANRLAQYLRKLGAGPEVIVAFCLERSIELIVGLLGILKAGGAYAPLDPLLPKERLALMLEDTQAPVVLTQQSLLEVLPDGAARPVCLDRDWAEIAAEAAANSESAATSANLMYVLYTSGSTGFPKAVPIEHRQLSNYLNSIMERLDLDPGMSFATVSTMAADLGNTVIFPSLCTGGCLHVISQQRASDPARLSQYFKDHAIDCLKIVPSHLAALLTCAHPEQVLPRRRLILGGEASNWELIEKVGKLAPDCMVFNHYGPTETTVGVLTHRVTGAERRKASACVPLGKPISNIRVYLLDPKSRPVPIGVTGELYVAGAGLARGYLNQPETTAEKFVPDSFASEPGARLYKTGDLARWWPDGTMEFLGRVDHQVKIRGFRVEPGEIEALIEQHASVRKTVVVAREETPGEKRLVAYVVPRTKTALAAAMGTGSQYAPAPSGQAVPLAELRRFLSQKLPDHMIPSAFVILNDLPLTPNGKIDMRALPAPGQTRPGLEEEYEAPRNCIEEIVVGIWSQVMGVERIGVHDNFFELGGHSLLATQVIAWVREEFQIEIPLRVLFEGATVAHMAEAIRANEPVPGQAEKMARVLLKVAAMPDGNDAEAGL